MRLQSGPGDPSGGFTTLAASAIRSLAATEVLRGGRWPKHLLYIQNGLFLPVLSPKSSSLSTG